MSSKRYVLIRDMAQVSLFVALITIGAFIRIPTLLMPITMQLAFCMLSGLILGWKKGSTAVLIYLVMGLIGLPVFAYGGGIAYIFKPSFGYILAFSLAALITGIVSNTQIFGKSNPFWRNLIGCIIAVIVVHAVGISYMYLIFNFYLNNSVSFGKVFVSGCLMFLPTDFMWSILASGISVKINKALKKSGYNTL